MKNYYKILLQFFVVSLISFSSFSQSLVTGVVVDGSTDEPLIGANVSIKGTTDGTFTGLDGSFSFSADPSPGADPNTESTVCVVQAPAFGIGEFSLVLDNAIRTANVESTTPLKYGILDLEGFTNIVKKNPEIGGSVYFEVAKAAVNNLATASADISNLTQAFFFALSR